MEGAFLSSSNRGINLSLRTSLGNQSIFFIYKKM